MQRNAYLDNIKVSLIFLVVFGHMIQPFIADSGGLRTLYVWVYLFHMPLFIFASGFFAKGKRDKDYIINLVKKLIIPYLVFQLIYTGYYYMIAKPDWQNDLFYPQWSLWFLLSLFCWHLLLIFYKRLKPLQGISLAILLGVVIGYFSGIDHTFSLSRTFVFFPFFLIGYWVTEKQLLLAKRKSMKAVSLIVMALFAIVIYYLPNFDTGWLLHSSPYAELGVGLEGGIFRMAIYLASAILGVSILAWIPTQPLKGFTYLGTRTLYIYLLHGFFVQFFRQKEIFSVSGVFDVIGIAAISVGLVYLLSSKYTIALFQPLVEGKTSILRRKLNQQKG